MYNFSSQGDSIQNILGDLVSCALGYVLGTVFAAVEFWWISLIWIVASEVNSISTETASFKWVVDLKSCAPKLFICVCSYKV